MLPLTDGTASADLNSHGAMVLLVDDQVLVVQTGTSPLEPEKILFALERIFLEPGLYEATCENAMKVAKRYFSRTAFNASVDALLGISSTASSSYSTPCAASPAS